MTSPYQRQWASSGSDDREEDPDGLGEAETDRCDSEDEPNFPDIIARTHAEQKLGGYGVPVFEANGGKLVTHHADLSEWRKL